MLVSGVLVSGVLGERCAGERGGGEWPCEKAQVTAPPTEKAREEGTECLCAL